jgi:hypothetical protein
MLNMLNALVLVKNYLCSQDTRHGGGAWRSMRVLHVVSSKQTSTGTTYAALLHVWLGRWPTLLEGRTQTAKNYNPPKKIKNKPQKTSDRVTWH